MLILYFLLMYYSNQSICQNEWMDMLFYENNHFFNQTEFTFTNGILSFSYWFRYEPKFSSNQPFFIIPNTEEIPQNIGNLLFFIYDSQSKKYRLFNYFDLNVPYYFSTFIITDVQQTQYSWNIKQFDTEGIWQFTLIILDKDQSQLTQILYNNLDNSIEQYITTFSYQNSKIIGQIGVQGNFNDENIYFQFNKFYGQITNLNVQNGELDINDQNILITQLQQCYQLNTICQLTTQLLIPDVFNFYDGSQINIQSSDFQIDTQFQFEGWIIIDDQQNNDEISILEIREQDTFQSYIQDDYNLLLQLQYKLQDDELFVFCLANSIKSSLNYTQSNILTFQIDINYIYTWHFITFKYDKIQKISQIIIDFPLYNNIVQQTFNSQIFWFSGTNITIRLGSNEYRNQYFYGQLAKIKILSCTNINQQISLSCDLSCLTCFGPLYNNCLSCLPLSNRQLIAGRCLCQNGYFSQNSYNDCVQINSLSFFSISQIQITEKRCKYGEFYVEYNNVIFCVQCPKKRSDLIIYCGDCYQDQLGWQNNLICTFNIILSDMSDSQSTYQTIRKQSDIYLLNINSQSINLCVGCKEICNDDDCQEYQQTTYGKKIKIRCQNNYYFSNGQCIQCDVNCLKCQNSICLQCKNEYTFNQIIQKCEKNDISYSCGYKCNICKQYNNQMRCLFCENGYKLLKDGINCIIYSISNCLVEQDYGSQLSTIPYLFNISQLKTIKLQPYCYDCQTTNFNQITQECGTVTLSDCDYSITTSNNEICLIGTSTITTQACSTINYCNMCIIDNSINFQYCVQCQSGYFLNIFNGICIKCPLTLYCAECNMQILTPDSNLIYKQLIIYYYQQQLDNYLDSLLYLSLDSFEIGCLSCQKQKQIVNGKCYNKCPSNCDQCNILNGEYTCIKCIQTYQIVQSENCLNCPLNCLACIQRTSSEISSLNSQFNQSNTDFSFFSNKCYKPISTDVYLEKSYQTPIICESDQLCKIIVNLTLNVYCSKDDYLSDYSISTNQAEFLISNFYIQESKDFFNNYYYSEYFQSLLNFWQTQILTIIFNIIGSNEQGQMICSIIDSFYIYEYFKESVFFLQEVNLQIIGQNQLRIELPKEIQIINFTNVEFNNIQFYGLDQQSIINVSSYDPNFVLSITNCEYTSIELSTSNNSLSFITQYIQLLNIINFTIKDTILATYDIFQISTQINITIIVKKLIIKNSNFTHLNIFSINNDLNNILNFEQFYISSNFYNVSLISYNNSNQLLGQISLDSFIISESIFYGSKYFIYALSGINLVQDFQLTNSQFYNYSSLFFMQSCQIQTLLINQCYLYLGYFINNYIETLQSYLNDEISISFQDLNFTNNHYSKEKQFINIVNNFQFNIIINQMIIKNNIPDFEKISDNSLYLQPCISLQGKTLQANNIIIIKGIGIMDILLEFNSVKIVDLYIQQLEEYQSLIQATYFCYIDAYNYQFFTPAITIQNSKVISIDQLNIINMNVVDYYVLLIKDNSQDTSVSISNIIINNNKLIVLNSNINLGIILFIFEEFSIVDISYIQAINNVMYSYSEDLGSYLATLINFQGQNSNISISYGTFTNNYALNSTFSIIYINAYFYLLTNSDFFNNNNNDIIQYQDKISDNFEEDITVEQLKNIYSQLNLGGNGQFITQNLEIQNCQFINSTAKYGGGLYILTEQEGNVLINNSIFSYLFTDLSESSQSNGGGIYINSQNSKLNLKILNCLFNNIMTKVSGGVFYIKSSIIYNNIYIYNIQCQNIIALSGLLIYSEFPSEDISVLQIEKVVTQLSQEWVNQYFSQLFGFKLEYQSLLKSYGAYIATSSGRIILQEIKILENYYFGFFAFQNLIYGIVYDVLITNTQSLYMNLFLISMHQQYNDAKLFIEQMLIENCNSDLYFSSTGCTDTFTLNIADPLLQCNTVSLTRTISQYLMTSDDYSYNCDCNQNLLTIFTYFLNLTNVMDIFQIRYFDSQSLQQILFLKNICVLNCAFDMLDQYLDATSLFTSSANNGSVQFDHHFVVKSSFTGFGKLYATNVETQRLLSDSDTQLDYSLFITNFLTHLIICYSGSGLFSIGSQMIFMQNIVSTNQTVYGNILQIDALLPNIITIINMIITDNKLYQYTYPIRIGLQNVDQLGEAIKSNIVIRDNYDQNGEVTTNKSPYFGEKLGFSSDGGLTQFVVNEKYNDNTKIIDQVYINAYTPAGYTQNTSYLMLPSGQSVSSYQYFNEDTEEFVDLNLNLSIILQNREREAILLTSGRTYTITISSRVLNDSNPIETTEFNTFQTISQTFSSQQLSYLPITDLSVQFDPYTDSALYLQLKFQIDLVNAPTFSDTYPYLQNGSLDSYELRINVRTYHCQVGEYIYLNECKQCDSNLNYYQVVKGATFCYFQDDTSTISVKAYTVQLKVGYWRYRFNSTKFESCYHYKDNCLGGWNYGDQSCITGHIGALCEQCDLYNIRGDGSFSVSSSYQCNTCSEVKYNIIIIIIIGLLTLFLGAITVKSNKNDTQEFNLRSKIKAFGIAPSARAMSTILIKMLTNYAQIISSIFTFQLILPSEIQTSTNSIGNPTQSMVYSLDCFLIQMSNVPILYLEFLWMLATPFLFISIIYSGYLIMVFIKFTSFSIGVMTTTIIYFYIYLQPNLIQNMISQLSKRTISEIDFIQGNVAYLYYTETHKEWISYVISPLLIIIGLLIPFLLWFIVYKNRTKLDSILVRTKWGYIYNEYRAQAFYWETIKLIQKEAILLALNYYEDQITIKASLILLIVFLYHISSNKFQPYYVIQLNQIDTFSTIVCSVSIILCSTIYSAQQNGQAEIVWPFYLITAIINFLFIIKLLLEIASSYLVQYQNIFDRLKKFIASKCPHFLERYPIIKSVLITKQEKQQRINKRYQMIKEYLFKKARRIVKARRTTVNKSQYNQSPDSYYQGRGGASYSLSPIMSLRDDQIKGDESQSQINNISQNQRRQMLGNSSSQSIRLVHSLYKPGDQSEIQNKGIDEYQVNEDDNLSHQVVYLSINPKHATRSQIG